MYQYNVFKSLLLSSTLLVGVSGCGGEDESADRGGPDSLIGFQWTTDPVTNNGIEFEFGFRFDRDTVTAVNTCDGQATASATAPVVYRYSASIPAGDSREENSGDANCFVEVARGSFDFEIVGTQLHMTAGGASDPVIFDSVGASAGLYGLWRADAPGVGTFTWKMGGGRIESTVDCDNGLNATVTVDADFTNYFEIVSAAEDSVTDGALTCDIAIAAGTNEYFFRGSDLVMISGGAETIFHEQ